MFEKYDGVRAFWNPDKKVFYSRQGRKFFLPPHIIEGLPDIFLGGELWYVIFSLLDHSLIFPIRFGRDRFQEALKISNRIDSSQIDWKNFKYMAFDSPSHRGSYEQRYNFLGKKIVF